MPVSSINGGAAYAAYTKPVETNSTKTADKAATTDKTATAAKTNEAELEEVTFEKSEAPVAKTGYEKTNRLTKEQISRLESMREESLRNMVSQLLSMQARGGVKAKKSSSDLSDLLGSVQSASNSASVEGEQSSEDFYGVDAVATRIMDMAVSLSGGDTSKIETLKNAVIKGFEEAGVAFGKKLPDVCNKTYDEIMKRFDHWEKNGSLDGYTYKAAEEE